MHYEEFAVNGLRAAHVESKTLKLDILAGLGAKIYNLIYRPHNHNLLWHNPRRVPVAAPFGSNFDDWWPGGWDEPFPNGEQTMFRGNALPFLGELWTLPWSIEHDSSEVHLWCASVITPARVEKWIRISDVEPRVQFRHRITNTGFEPLDFMFGIHPALRVSPGSRIYAPVRRVLVAESRDNKLGVVGNDYAWPTVLNEAGHPVDLSTTPEPSSLTYGFLYAHELSGGWCAVTDKQSQVGLALSFPTDIFTCLWLWLVYGGWRGLYHVAVEPWTSYPTNINEAYDLGRTKTLNPGASLDFTVSAIVYHDPRPVQSVSNDEVLFTNMRRRDSGEHEISWQGGTDYGRGFRSRSGNRSSCP